MRAAFRLFLIVLFLAVAIPAVIAVNFWMDASSVIARAEQSGALRPAANAQAFTTLERTIAIDQFSQTWGFRAIPCRTAELLWMEFTNPDVTVPSMPVSQALASKILPDRRGSSVRWHMQRTLVACQLEQRFQDAQLFRAWLARANFGQNMIGADAAAQAVFQKPARDLSQDEASRVAALLHVSSLRTQPDRWTEQALAITERVTARPR